MNTLYRHFLQADLLQLSAAIQDAQKRSLFLDSIVYETSRHHRGEDGKVWVRIYLDSAVGQWVQELAKEAKLSLARLPLGR